MTEITHDRKATMNVSRNERLLSAVSGGALLAYGLRRRSIGGALLALLGGGLLLRGATGHCAVYKALGIRSVEGRTGTGISVERQITINRPVAQVYAFWRNLENLPRFMKHLQEVQVHDAVRSHWVATAPLGTHVAWDATVIQDRPNERITWKSLPGATVPNGGSVFFTPGPGGVGTVVHAVLSYEPPAGRLGSTVAMLFGEEPGQQIAGDLRRLRSILEADEIPNINGQPSGRGRQQAQAEDRAASWAKQDQQQEDGI
jgi:uncharacterized membrane protein